MKKTFVSLMLLFAALCSSQIHCRWVENATPFFANITMKIGGINETFSLAPGERHKLRGVGSVREGYCALETRYIVPDSIRPLLGPNFKVKEGADDVVEVRAQTWYGDNENPNTTWFIGGPRCTGSRCTTDSNSDSLFKYSEFKTEYDAELKKLPSKPTSQRELARISSALIQQDRFWRLTDADLAAKTGAEVLIRNADPSKNVYYVYAGGQKTRHDSVKFNSQINTTSTFAIK